MSCRYFTLNSLKAAAASVRAGSIIAYPTEAVYGLGCDPYNSDAVSALYRLKQRSSAQGFLLIASEYKQVANMVDAHRVPAHMLERAMATWPGPVTWIFPRSSEAPAWVTGNHEGIAIRVTAHPAAAALCREFGGPLVSTSANPHGRTPARSAQDVERYFDNGLGGILDAPLGTLQQPTSIYDAMTGKTVRA